jgi:outer membrane protein TolC
LKTQKNRNEIFKNWVSHQALLSAWRVNVYQELFRHSSERARRLGIIKKYLETRPRVSVRQKVELNILSNILLQLEKMLDQKEFDLKVALSELEYWVGKRIEPRELEFRIPNLDVGVVPKSDIERDPDYLEAKVLTQSSELDFELAKKERRPDLFFGGGYRLEDVVPLNHFTYGILGLNMPLWDSGYERKQAAQARILRDQHNFRDIKRKVEIKQLKQIETVLFWAKQVQRFSHAHIPYQERAVDIAEDGFKKGLIDVNTFLQSETQSHEAVDQIYLSWFTYLENLSLLQLMRNESFSWEKI